MVVLLSAGLSIILISVLVCSIIFPPYYINVSQSLCAMLAVFIIVAILSYKIFLKNIIKFNCKIKYNIKQIARLMMYGALYTLMLYIGFSLMQNPETVGWDSGIVVHYAKTLTESAPTEAFRNYFIGAPNNAMTVFLLYVVERALIPIFGNYLAIVVWFNVTCVFLSFVLLIKTLKLLFYEKVSLVIGLLIIPLMVITPYLAIYYSDTLGLLVISAICFLFVKSMLERKIKVKTVLLAMSIVLAVFGILIKPTTIFIAIPAILAEIYMLKDWRFITLGSILLFLSLGVGVNSLQPWVMREVGIEQRRDSGFPVWHFARMGSEVLCYHSSERCFYGGFYPGAVVQYYNEYQGDKNEFSEFSRTKTFDNISEMKWSYAYFLANKSAQTFGDGSFYAYREGAQMIASLWINEQNYPNVDYARNAMYYNGKYFLVYEVASQVSWLLIIMLAILSFGYVIKNKKHDWRLKVFTVLALAVALEFVFLMVFETRSRYLFMFLPVFAVCAGFGFIGFYGEASPQRLSLTSLGHKSQENKAPKKR